MGATYFDLVRRFFPEASDEECDYLLWGATCFPMGGLMTVARQLKRNALAAEERKSVCMRCGELFDNGGKVTFEEVCECSGT